MQVWPGNAYPLGATFDGTGTNFALFSEVAEKVELCLFDDDRVEIADRADRGRRLRLARLPARGAAGPALRLPRARAVGSRRRACAATRTSCCSTRTRRRPATTSGGASRCSRTSSTIPTSATTTTRRRACCSASSSNPFFDWTGDRAPKIPYAEIGHLRGARQGPHRAAPRHPGGAARHLRRDRAPRDHRAPAAHRRHRDRADAGAPVPARLGARGEGPAQLLGLQHDRVLRPARRLRIQRPARPAGAGVQVHGARPARGRHRGDPGCRLQPHRGGQPPGAHGLDARHRQRRVLPPRRGRRAALHGLHRHRQLAQRRAPAHAAADHGLAALLGDRDARRRVPLRPRRDAGPRVLRGRPAVARSSSSCSRTRSCRR